MNLISKMKFKYSSLFIVPFIMMLGVFLCLRLTPYSPNTITSGDFASQYFPLYIGLHQLFWKGDFAGLFWSFEKSLGGAMPSVWGFNSLSPFTFLYVLFPISSFQIVTYVIPLLRVGTMGLAFGYYLQKKYHGLTTRYWLTLGLSTSYALSGFVISQHYNPNFLDNLVYVPFLFLGIEELVSGKKSLKLPLFLGISLITNFYTGYMMCLLIVLYTLYVVLGEKQSIRGVALAIGKVALFSLLGIGLAACWLFPVFHALLDSKASSGDTFRWSFQTVNDLLSMSQKLIVGSFGEKEWGDPHALPQLFVGSIGLFGVVSYFLSGTIPRRKKFSALLTFVILILSFHIQGLDQLWHMGQRPVGFYFRNSWVMNAFMLGLAAEGLMTLKKTTFRKVVFGFGILCAGILIESMIVPLSFVEPYQKGLAVFFWGMLIVITIIPKWTRNQKEKLVTCFALIELTANAFIGLARVPYYSSNQGLQEQIQWVTSFSEVSSETQPKFTRKDFHKGLTLANLPLEMQYNGGSHFTSSLESSLIEELGHLGLATSKSVVNYVSRNLILDSILGFSEIYIRDSQNASYPDVTELYVKKDTFQNFTGYRNPYVFSLGFLTNEEQATAVQFEKNNPASNLNQLLSVLGLNNQGMLKEIKIAEPVVKNLDVSGTKRTRISENEPTQLTFNVPMSENHLYFVQIPVSQSGAVNQSNVQLDGKSYAYENRFKENQLWLIGNGNLKSSLSLSFEDGKAKEWNLQEFKFYEVEIPTLIQKLQQYRNDNDIQIDSYSNVSVVAQATVTNTEHSFATFTIPYSSGWSVSVDGVRSEVKKSLGLFMGVQLSKGQHEIVWTYHPPGLILGSSISFISALIIAGIYYHSKKKS